MPKILIGGHPNPRRPQHDETGGIKAGVGMGIMNPSASMRMPVPLNVHRQGDGHAHSIPDRIGQATRRPGKHPLNTEANAGMVIVNTPFHWHTESG